MTAPPGGRILRLALRGPFAAAILAASCSPKPGVQLSPSGTIVNRGYLDSVGRHAAAERRDSPRRNAADQANLTALAVDSVLVRPDSLLLAVGDTVSLFGGTITWTARDRTGAPVSGFTPWFRIDNSRMATLLGEHLVALAPGRGALLLIVAVRSDSLPPRLLHTTRLPIVVR